MEYSLQPLSSWNTLASEQKSGTRLLLKAGDTFRGWISINNRDIGPRLNNIVIDSFGVGPKPLLKGSSLVTGWTQSGCDGEVWSAPVPARLDGSPLVLGEDEVVEVFFDGGRGTTARHPNCGMYTIDADGTPNSFCSGSLVGLPSLIGASCHYRSTLPWYGKNRIVAHNAVSGCVKLEKNITKDSNFGFARGWGFFVADNRALLDTDSEWIYDQASSAILIFSRSDPAARVIEAAIGPVKEFTVGEYPGPAGYETSVDIRKSDQIVVRNLHFSQQAVVGIRAWSSTHISFESCDQDFSKWGMQISDSEFVTVVGSTFHDNAINGINVDQSTMVTMGPRNIITNTGTRPGYGANEAPESYSRNVALRVSGSYDASSVVWTGNTVDGVGRMCIESAGAMTIMNSIFRNCCQTTRECGGLSLGYPGTIVRNNLIENVYGSLEYSTGDRGWTSPAPRIISGIRCFRAASDCIIDQNTVIRSGTSGIIVREGSSGDQLTNNVLVENGWLYSGDGTTNPGLVDRGIDCTAGSSHVITGNTIIQTRPNGVYTSITDPNAVSVQNYNLHCNPTGSVNMLCDSAVSNCGSDPTRGMSLSSWGTLYNEEVNGATCPSSLPSYSWSSSATEYTDMLQNVLVVFNPYPTEQTFLLPSSTAWLDIAGSPAINATVAAASSKVFFRASPANNMIKIPGRSICASGCWPSSCFAKGPTSACALPNPTPSLPPDPLPSYGNLAVLPVLTGITPSPTPSSSRFSFSQSRVVVPSRSAAAKTPTSEAGSPSDRPSTFSHFPGASLSGSPSHALSQTTLAASYAQSVYPTSNIWSTPSSSVSKKGDRDDGVSADVVVGATIAGLCCLFILVGLSLTIMVLAASLVTTVRTHIKSKKEINSMDLGSDL